MHNTYTGWQLSLSVFVSLLVCKYSWRQKCITKSITKIWFNRIYVWQGLAVESIETIIKKLITDLVF